MDLVKKMWFFHFKAEYYISGSDAASSCIALKIPKELKVIVCFQGTSQLCSFLYPRRQIWDQNSGLSSHPYLSASAWENLPNDRRTPLWRQSKCASVKQSRQVISAKPPDVWVAAATWTPVSFSRARFLFCLCSCVLSQLSYSLVRVGAAIAKRKKCEMQSKVTFTYSLWVPACVCPHICDVLAKILLLLVRYGSPQVHKTICLKV